MTHLLDGAVEVQGATMGLLSGKRRGLPPLPQVATAKLQWTTVALFNTNSNKPDGEKRRRFGMKPQELFRIAAGVSLKLRWVASELHERCNERDREPPPARGDAMELPDSTARRYNGAPLETAMPRGAAVELLCSVAWCRQIRRLDTAMERSPVTPTELQWSAYRPTTSVM